MDIYGMDIWKEEIYMKLPALNKNEETKIVKLLRPIYGLK